MYMYFLPIFLLWWEKGKKKKKKGRRRRNNTTAPASAYFPHSSSHFTPHPPSYSCIHAYSPSSSSAISCMGGDTCILHLPSFPSFPPSVLPHTIPDHVPPHVLRTPLTI
jgi:hypothetical protein